VNLLKLMVLHEKLEKNTDQDDKTIDSMVCDIKLAQKDFLSAEENVRDILQYGVYLCEAGQASQNILNAILKRAIQSL